MINIKLLVDKWRLRLDQNFRVSKGSRNFWVMMVPSYDNLGDSAITETTIQFLKTHFPDFSIKEVSELTRSWQYHYLKHKMHNDDVIILPGGGNLGELWPETETMRQNLVKEFAGVSMISFPQSYSFFDKKNAIEVNAKKVYSENVDLFFFRDSVSKQKFENNFALNAQLAPDIVMTTFYSFINKNITKEFDVLAILRNDKEKDVKSGQDKIVSEIGDKWNIVKTDTKPLRGQLITRRNRRKIINEKNLQIRKAKLVITDRLHGLIFSRAQGVPVVLFSNSDGKVINLYETWLKNDEGVFIADGRSEKEIISWIDSNMGHIIAPKKFDREFEDFKSEIEKVVYDQ